MPGTDQHKFLIGLAWVSVFALLLLAGTLGRVWALPGLVPLGQTIPPPPTRTSTARVPEATSTWTPRPTWTRVPTQQPEPPTATPTPVANLPTATRASAQATATAPLPSPEASMTPARLAGTSTVAAIGPTPRLSHTPSGALPTPDVTYTLLPPTPPATPIPLAFEVAVVPPVAGPRDVVSFIVQVANVGYEPVEDIQLEAVLPDDLGLQSVECPRCTVECPQCGSGSGASKLTIWIGRLVSGDQVIAPVQVQVADDIWPGQTLRVDWTLVATGLPGQTAQANVVLPWAPLPSTGGE